MTPRAISSAKKPHVDCRHRDCHHRIALPECGNNLADRGHDEDPVEAVADRGARPVTEGRVKPDVVAEARLRVGEDAGV